MNFILSIFYIGIEFDINILMMNKLVKLFCIKLEDLGFCFFWFKLFEEVF